MKIKVLILSILLTWCNVYAHNANISIKIKSKNSCLINYKDNLFGKTFYLPECNLNDSDIEDIVNIANIYKIDSLVLRENPQLTGAGLTKLLKNKSINDVDLSSIATSKEQAIGIAESVAKSNQWSNVLLMNNRIGDEAASLLAQNMHITGLVLSNNSITSRGASFLAENQNFMYLVLDNNKINNEGAAQLLRNQFLVYISLSNNKLSGVLKTISASSFRDINLSNNKITKLISDQTNNTTLKYLFLSSNPVSDENLKFLSQFIGLYQLDISDTNITNSGLKYVIDNYHNIHALGVRQNSLNNDSAKLLLKSNIVEIDLYENNIGPDGGMALAKKQGLVLLDIGANQIGDTAALGFTKSCPKSLRIRNTKLLSSTINALKDSVREDCINELTTGNNEYGTYKKHISQDKKITDNYKKFLDVLKKFKQNKECSQETNKKPSCV